MISDWLDCHSWDPTLLMEKRPITQANQEPVEPAQRASVHHEPIPGTLDWLYQDCGGEA